QVAALYVLHRDVPGLLGDDRVEDRDDVRMPQLARERRLVLELRAVYGAELGIAEHLGLDGLERDFLSGKRVPGEIHHSRRAPGDRALDLVLADLKAQVQRGCRFRHALSRRYIATLSGR